MIRAVGLTKHYRHQLAVDNVSFEVATGKVTGFLGPNGAGKSTTMRLMLGLDKGAGKTTFDGKYLYQFAQPSKTVGILLEAKAFHPSRSARNHLRILAAAGGIADKRVDEVLATVGLQAVARKKPKSFSLGMSQRLGIAAAILGQPRYLLLDEPANGLDPEGIAWLRQFIKDYADAGNAVFVSSHLLSEMSQMADNIVVIGKGKLIASTTVKAMLTGGTESGVFIRTSSMSKLERILKGDNVSYHAEDGGLLVSGFTTDKLGRLAYDANVPVLELATRSASLEEAFFALTSDSQEYQAGTLNKKAPK